MAFMRALFDTSPIYLYIALGLLLAAKGFILWAICKKVTRRRTRIILIIWAGLLSPTLMTVTLFIPSVEAYAFLTYIPFLGWIFDLAALQWVRAITEPLKTLVVLINDKGQPGTVFDK